MKLTLRLKGGPGSGNFDHAGRPGLVGGSVSNDDYYVLRDYTMRGYVTLNKALRSDQELSHEDTVLRDTLDRTITNAGPVKQKTLYRALYMPPEELHMKVGSEYSDKAFMSTTKDARYMYTKLSDAHTRMTIKVPNGSAGLDMSAVTAKKYESEVLLPRNTRLRITRIVKNGDYWDVTASLL